MGSSSSLWRARTRPHAHSPTRKHARPPVHPPAHPATLPVVSIFYIYIYIYIILLLGPWSARAGGNDTHQSSMDYVLYIK